jgi:outer membrane protein OmpA-like peptidoglycan-associated protein
MLRKSCAALAPVVLLFGCTTGPDGERSVNKTAVGGVLGAVAGGVLGNQLDDDGNRDRGTITGAAVGAAAGAGLGYLMDRQERELKERLAGERAANAVQVERVRDDLLKLTLTNEVLFDYDSAAIKPAFAPTLETLADVLSKYDRNVVQVVGHTDATGPDAYNQGLSERRALAVVEQLAYRGVPRGRMTAIGRGEREPRADNSNEAGRQINRRVEIFVQPQEA